MKIIAGLGNPGMKYTATRHNIGFEVIERLAYEHNIKVDLKKHQGLVGQGVIKGEKVILVKPLTYMNKSGECIRSLMDFYKLTTDDLIVVYDDTSLDLGRLRIRVKGSAGGHNGIKNIISHMGSQEFPRVKVGVGEKPPGWDLADYVLSRFRDDEMNDVKEAVKEGVTAVEAMLSEGLQPAMNLFNAKRKEG